MYSESTSILNIKSKATIYFMKRNLTLAVSVFLCLFADSQLASKAKAKKYPSLFWEITGNGLKDIKSAMQAVSDQQPKVVRPTLVAVREAVSELGLI